MKAVVMTIIIIALIIALINTKFNSTRSSAIENKEGVKILNSEGLGTVLGEAVKQVEREFQDKPQKFIEQTAINVIDQISSDAAILSDNIINSIISKQFVNSYNNLSSEAKSHVREAVCK